MMLSKPSPGQGPMGDPLGRSPSASGGRIRLLTPGWSAMVLGAVGTAIVLVGPGSRPDDRPASAPDSVVGWGEGVVRAVAFSADDSLVAALESANRLTLWEADGSGLRAALDAEGAGAFALHPGGEVVALGGVGEIRLRDVRTGRDCGRLEAGDSQIHALAFSPDGRRLAAGDGDRRLMLWDLETGERLLDLEAHRLPVISLAFSPDGRRLAAISGDGMLTVRDAGMGALRSSVVPGWRPRKLAFSPDGRSLLVNVGWDRLWQVDAETLLVERRYLFPGRFISSMALAHDGERIALGGLQAVEVVEAARFEDRSPPRDPS